MNWNWKCWERYWRVGWEKPKYLERAFGLKRNLGLVQNLGVTTDALNAAFHLPKMLFLFKSYPSIN